MSKRSDAVEFVRRWRGILAKVPASQNNEQQDTQKFWNDLLENVLGVPGTTLPSYVDYERRVRGRRIDVFIEDHHFLCEQKSVGIDLDKPEVRRGDGAYTRAYIQGHRGSHPLYTAKNDGPAGFIDTFDHEGPCLTVSLNGLAGRITIIAGKFSCTADRAALLPRRDDIDQTYFRAVAEPATTQALRHRSMRAPVAPFRAWMAVASAP